jgi:hypothetical protein
MIKKSQVQFFLRKEIRMVDARSKKIANRWAFMVLIASALFWGIWYLVAGHVPSVTSIRIAPHHTFALPFCISRWWDVLLAPLWAWSIARYVTGPDVHGDANWLSLRSSAAELVVGLIFGLMWGLLSFLLELPWTLAWVLITAFIMVVISPKSVEYEDACLGLIAGAAVTSAFSLGFAFGIVMLIGIAIVALLGIALARLVRWLCRTKTWQSFGHWLLGREEQPLE